MKEFPSNSLSYSKRQPSTATKGMLMIRQADIEEGYMTSGGAHRFLWSLLEGGGQPSSGSPYVCREGYNNIWIYVYRYDPTLQYSLHLSHGSVSGKMIEGDNKYTQRIKFSSSREQRLMFPNYGTFEYGWLDNKVYDMDGNPIAPPHITVDGDVVSVDRKVFGTLLYTYKVPRDRYRASIPFREDAGESAFDSVAYALHKGGPTWAEIQAPDSLKEYCDDGGDGFGWGDGTVIDGDDDASSSDDDGIPSADGMNSEKKIDYCSGEVIYDKP